MAIKFPKNTAPRNFDSVAALKKIDDEIKDILEFLTTEEQMEPDCIIDNTERLHELAKKRKVVVNLIMEFSEIVWVSACE